jgi:uncharacterized protein
VSVPLLDVNVLVALAWPNHVHHRAAVSWFTSAHADGWATCPVTQSGFVRVSSNRRVIPDARSPREAATVLRALLGMAGHAFWADDVSIAHADEVDLGRLQGYRQVTDAHLLALAARRGGRLVTFDGALADLQIAPVVVLTLDGA